MAIGLAALGLLTFLLGCPGTFAETQTSEPAGKCVLTGSWRNDLNYTMKINKVSKTGVFSNVDEMSFGPFWDYIRPHPPPDPLVGIQHFGHQPTFGFTVSGKVYGFAYPSEYTLIFVGQCLVDKEGKEQLKTIQMLFPAQDWGGTSVGMETFYRTE